MSTSAREGAIRWIEQGFSPVPIPSQSKAPVLPGWPDLRITGENVSEYFNGSAMNIGLLLGLDGATDADLDCAEAISIAPAFLPATGHLWPVIEAAKPLALPLGRRTGEEVP